MHEKLKGMPGAMAVAGAGRTTGAQRHEIVRRDPTSMVDMFEGHVPKNFEWPKGIP